MKQFMDYISINPDIRFGKPCIMGSRIAVVDVLQWLASGMSFDEILADFPELTLEQIKAAIAFAAHKEAITQYAAASDYGILEIF